MCGNSDTYMAKALAVIGTVTQVQYEKRLNSSTTQAFFYHAYTYDVGTRVIGIVSIEVYNSL